jgi:DNA repair protein RAD50
MALFDRLLLTIYRRSIDREKKTIESERQHRTNVLQNHTNELHRLQLKESDLRGQLREKELLLASIKQMQEEITSLQQRNKVLFYCFDSVNI